MARKNKTKNNGSSPLRKEVPIIDSRRHNHLINALMDKYGISVHEANKRIRKHLKKTRPSNKQEPYKPGYDILGDMDLDGIAKKPESAWSELDSNELGITDWEMEKQRRKHDSGWDEEGRRTYFDAGISYPIKDNSLPEGQNPGLTPRQWADQFKDDSIGSIHREAAFIEHQALGKTADDEAKGLAMGDLYGRKWIEDWYSNPETKRRLGSVHARDLGVDIDGFEKDLNEMANSLLEQGYTESQVADWKDQQRKGLADSVGEGVSKEFLDKSLSAGIRRGDVQEGALATYDPKEHMIDFAPYGKAAGMRALPHERVHASGYDDILGKKAQEIMGMPKDDNEYLAKPGELYGNLTDVRAKLWLKPGEKLTKERLEKGIKDGVLKDEGYLFKSFDKDKIIEAINTIAANEEELDPDTALAYRSPLTSRKPYLGIGTRYWDSLNPGLSPITNRSRGARKAAQNEATKAAHAEATKQHWNELGEGEKVGWTDIAKSAAGAIPAAGAIAGAGKIGKLVQKVGTKVGAGNKYLGYADQAVEQLFGEGADGATVGSNAKNKAKKKATELLMKGIAKDAAEAATMAAKALGVVGVAKAAYDTGKLINKKMYQDMTPEERAAFRSRKSGRAATRQRELQGLSPATYQDKDRKGQVATEGSKVEADYLGKLAGIAEEAPQHSERFRASYEANADKIKAQGRAERSQALKIVDEKERRKAIKAAELREKQLLDQAHNQLMDQTRAVSDATKASAQAAKDEFKAFTKESSVWSKDHDKQLKERDKAFSDKSAQKAVAEKMQTDEYKKQAQSQIADVRGNDLEAAQEKMRQQAKQPMRFEDMPPHRQAYLRMRKARELGLSGSDLKSPYKVKMFLAKKQMLNPSDWKKAEVSPISKKLRDLTKQQIRDMKRNNR